MRHKWTPRLQNRIDQETEEIFAALPCEPPQDNLPWEDQAQEDGLTYFIQPWVGDVAEEPARTLVLRNGDPALVLNWCSVSTHPYGFVIADDVLDIEKLRAVVQRWVGQLEDYGLDGFEIHPDLWR